MRLPLRAGLSLILLAVPTVALADTIYVVPDTKVKNVIGGAVRGSIQGETTDAIQVRVGTTLVNVPTADVASVTYDGQPASFGLAETRENAGQLAEAAEQYKKAAADAANRPFLAQAAQFGQARVVAELAFSDASRRAEAVSLLTAFTRKYPNSRHTVAALEVQAKLQLQAGSVAELEQTLSQIAATPRGADRAAVLRVKIFTRQGEHEKALAALEPLITSAPEGSVKKRDALLAKAESLVAVKKYTEAETTLRGVIKAAGAEDAATQAVAYNTLGDCLRAANKPKDALYAYLHTDLLYSKDKEQHQKALARLSQVWKDLNNAERSVETMERLKQEYPKSQYLTNAGK